MLKTILHYKQEPKNFINREWKKTKDFQQEVN